MNEQPKLSEAEWALVIQLLQANITICRRNHHCRVASYRKELQHRHEMVKNLLERLHAI